jgi:signal transduction histidine kinase
MNWINYHIVEEFFIALVCSLMSWKIAGAYLELEKTETEKKGRLFLFGSGFLILGLSSSAHAYIHVFGLDENLLYQSLVGYSLGLILLITGISSEKPESKKYIAFFYVPFLVLLVPGVYRSFPLFGAFRPLLWVFIAYFTGILCILYMALYYHKREERHLYSIFALGLIGLSSILLFFPADIGSNVWVCGHLSRPLGFAILPFSMKRNDFASMKGSILYKALASFCLLAAIPLFIFGTVLFYENAHTSQILDKRVILFLLLLITLLSALVFSFGLIIRLVRPILRLKESIARLSEEGFRKKMDIERRDEIGELSNSFNEMLVKLQYSMAEQDRLSRLAATGELAATLAHEIKNPLSSIWAASAYIEKNFRGNLISEFLRVINEEVSRINKLTAELLDFAKPINHEPVESDLNRLVEDTARLLEGEFRENGVALEARLDPRMRPARFDYDRMKQVLLNLLINSLAAVEQKGESRKSVTVSTGAENGRVFVSVEDNGTGIKDEILKDIFNPFFTTKTRGTGLGLAVCKKIVKQHGGEVLVETETGKGSRFKVLLPAVR